MFTAEYISFMEISYWLGGNNYLIGSMKSIFFFFLICPKINIFFAGMFLINTLIFGQFEEELRQRNQQPLMA